MRRWQARRRSRMPRVQSRAEFTATVSRLASLYPNKVKPH